MGVEARKTRPRFVKLSQITSPPLLSIGEDEEEEEDNRPSELKVQRRFLPIGCVDAESQ